MVHLSDEQSSCRREETWEVARAAPGTSSHHAAFRFHILLRPPIRPYLTAIEDRRGFVFCVGGLRMSSQAATLLLFAPILNVAKSM